MRAAARKIEATPPTAAQVREAEQAVRAFAEVLPTRGAKGSPRISVRTGGSASEVTIPRAAFDLLVGILEEMAAGRAVTVMPFHQELTTQQAADLLNVSRPHVVKLLDEGTIPFHRAGTHRRVRLTDVLAYRDRDLAERKLTADALAAEAQRLGLGYD